MFTRPVTPFRYPTLFLSVAAYELTKEQGFYEQNPGTETALIQMTAKAPTANSKGVRLGSFDQIRTIIDEELEAVWAGTKPAQEALDSAVERSEEHTSELQSLMRISYAVFCLKKKKNA